MIRESPNKNLKVKFLLDGRELKTNDQIMKFEMVSEGNRRSLIIKNVTKADFCKYSVKCNGERQEMTLREKQPFIRKVKDTQGFIGGIAVLECNVPTGTQVTWYCGAKKICRENFRYTDLP